MASFEKLWDDMATSLSTTACKDDSLASGSHCKLRSKLSTTACCISKVSRGSLCYFEMSEHLAVLPTLYLRVVVNLKVAFINVASRIIHNVIIVDLAPRQF
jgi:hypothetical protein